MQHSQILPFEAVYRPPSMTGFVQVLMAHGMLSSHQLLQWRAQSAGGATDFIRFLQHRCLLDNDKLYGLLAQNWQCPRLHPTRQLPDPRLLDRLGTQDAIRLEIVPWRYQAGRTVILAANPETYFRLHNRLTAIFGQVSLALAPWSEIEAAIHVLRGADLTQRAESAAPLDMSSRSFNPRHWQPALAVAGLTLTLALATVPGLVMVFFLALALCATTGFNLLKLAALMLDLVRPVPKADPGLDDAALPMITLLVPLYKEEAVARKLVRRMGVLDYPKNRLDIILVVEDDDAVTKRTLELADLGIEMRVLSVPAGTIRTKPRALNYALDQVRGEIIGIYDAEDAPEADHLRRVAARFAASDNRLACVQGVLDFYNPRHNWMSRCFTIEYAAWFRLLLPGIARLGLAVPLGGTTLFLRRQALEAMGGWDAHNVTEDADLGIRIARAGMRTELLDITTMEEANSQPIAWIKQRSRWVKGFMMTWIAHNRNPARLWADLGPWRFFGVQALLLGSIIHSLLAPLLWSLVLIPFVSFHPLQSAVPPMVFQTVFGVFVGLEIMLMLVGWRAITKTRHGLSPLWVVTMIFYYPLATAAAWKAAWELFRNPFYWDKTHHGAFSA